MTRHLIAVDCESTGARGDIPIRGASPDPHVYEWRPERVGLARPTRAVRCCAVTHPGCPRWEPKADAP